MKNKIIMQTYLINIVFQKFKYYSNFLIKMIYKL